MDRDDESSQDSNARFYVKRASGKVFGPFDKNAIRMMLKAEKIGPEAAVSTEKEDWTSVASVPAFADLIETSDSKGGTELGGFAAGSAKADETPGAVDFNDSSTW